MALKVLQMISRSIHSSLRSLQTGVFFIPVGDRIATRVDSSVVETMSELLNTRPLHTTCGKPFREAIELGLNCGRNAMAISQDRVFESGFSGGYQTVKRFVGKLRGNQQPHAVILTPPGEEAQVDYRTGPVVPDPQTGKYRRTRLFGMTLGYSRKAIRWLSFRSSTLFTSNQPVQDWGKLLGCSAAVTAMLDRLLHHGYVLERVSRICRTKMNLPPQEAAGQNNLRSSPLPLAGFALNIVGRS